MPVRQSRARCWPERALAPMSGRLMSRSTGCAAKSSGTRQIRFICKRLAGRATGCSLTADIERPDMSLSLPAPFEQPKAWWQAAARKAAGLLPKRLYARALLIVIAPIVILQGVLSYVFMEER